MNNESFIAGLNCRAGYATVLKLISKLDIFYCNFVQYVISSSPHSGLNTVGAMVSVKRNK